MRSVTMFLLESSWERDFSCLSISSSTFSRREGAMSLVEDSMMPSRNSTWGFQLVTVGVALPVEVHHDSGLLDIGDQLLVLLDQGVEFTHFCVSLILSALGHQDFQNLLEPLPDLSPLQIFAQ